MRERSPTPDSGRRHLMLAGAAGLGATAFAACARSTPGSAHGAAHSVTKAKVALTAQTTEGPYYFDARKIRADITEGLSGTPLDVRFRVVDADGTPFSGARVDIWHCNAAGVYSGYAGQGDDRRADASGATFLRGTQMADDAGEAVFHTLYPGWYRGRTTHIHFKVFDGQDAEALLTCQFFLPDALSEFLYEHVPAYARTQLRDTLKSTDGILLRVGDTVLGNVREENDRYVATLDVAVARNARPAAGRPLVPGHEGSGGRPLGPPPDGTRASRRSLQGEARIAALVPGNEAP